jgi:hypothetical protein
MKSFAFAALVAYGVAIPAPQVTESPASGPEPPVRSSEVEGPTSHGPFSGEPTTTGALSKPALAQSIAPGPPPPVTYVNNNGELQATAMPVPYQPDGGIETNGTEPYYRTSSIHVKTNSD